MGFALPGQYLNFASGSHMYVPSSYVLPTGMLATVCRGDVLISSPPMGSCVMRLASKTANAYSAGSPCRTALHQHLILLT